MYKQTKTLERDTYFILKLPAPLRSIASDVQTIKNTGKKYLFYNHGEKKETLIITKKKLCSTDGVKADKMSDRQTNRSVKQINKYAHESQ